MTNMTVIKPEDADELRALARMIAEGSMTGDPATDPGFVRHFARLVLTTIETGQPDWENYVDEQGYG